MPARFNTILRTVLLGSRWGLAPLCLGLLAALVIVFAEFCRQLYQAVIGFAGMGGTEVTLAVLKLVDLVLVANLVIMIVATGVEIFLPKAAEGAPPEATGFVDFAGIKLRLFGSISAIAAVDLLESFINIDPVDKKDVLWEILMLLAFVVSGVLLAWMDRLGAERH